MAKHTFTNFRNNTLCLLNELALAHRNADAETWPELRDEVLEKHNLMDLSFLEFDPSL